MRRIIVFLFAMAIVTVSVNAQQKSNHGNKFEQMGQMLPTPNSYRGPDGAPGPEYWQQRADYEIKCRLDDQEVRLDGQEKITYYNQSPNILRYLWLQLDENEHSAEADNNYFDPSSIGNVMSESDLRSLDKKAFLEKYGCKIQKVTDDNGNDLNYRINQTMMRVELPQPLKPGESFAFNIDWYYYIADRFDDLLGGRGGFEYFEENDNYLFTITQWFPRMCVYDDVEGWQNKQFTGRGEFALTFGDYVVQMDVPADYVVGSTGECLNYATVLTPTQLERWEKAKTSDKPVEIITLDEANKNAAGPKSKERKVWIYKAQNVRDFAWTACRKYVWDAMPHYNADGKRVMCMSYYPKESYSVYNRYSTKAVAHTLKTYSKYSIPYPYPVAISVEAANGMEYPMICFNPGRPTTTDGTYTERDKYRAISVIIHEVGHNYFPMIINSDERQWTWMDEGINTFVQFLAEQEFDDYYPSRRGPAYTSTSYMRQHPDRLEPIMTNSENIVEFGNNAYMKPAVGLNILRETIMGREAFDYAFKEYCERWAFKHPRPADFFRTMEDASGVDLDWFWKGWFYSIEPVDISLDQVAYFQVDAENDPQSRTQRSTWISGRRPMNISRMRNKEAGMKYAVDEDPDLQDFYVKQRFQENEDSVTVSETELYGEKFSKKEKKAFANNHYYELNFSNKGGLPMPIILEWTFEDGTKEVERIPVEVWRKNENRVTKAFMKTKKVESVKLDPYGETADVDESNNAWPEVPQQPSRFQIYKKHKAKETLNPMQKAQGKKIKP